MMLKFLTPNSAEGVNGDYDYMWAKQKHSDKWVKLIDFYY